MNVQTPMTYELAPRTEEEEIELSIVLPALNEEANIAECISWCLEGLRQAGVRGEIVIVDSSSDRTPDIALSMGARVVKTHKRGLGQAYIESLPFIRGRYVLMGDVDCTYDFRRLDVFVEKLREGYEFVMGSRFRGSIEPGAMPPHHQYFGTPLTTWILNRVYAGRFSDIHCGMRGIQTESLKHMHLVSASWEYASEMVIKSVHMGLRTTEVPVHFLKDRNGRQSHHVRTGWWSPWAAGWINLRAMFIYGASFFLLKPGMACTALGLLLIGALSRGPITIGGMTLSIFWMLLGLTLSVFGLQCIFTGVLSLTFYDYSGRHSAKYARIFSYNRMMGISMLLFLAGLALDGIFFWRYVTEGLSISLTAERPFVHHAVLGLFLMIAGFMLFAFTLILNGYLLSRQAGIREGEAA